MTVEQSITLVILGYSLWITSEITASDLTQLFSPFFLTFRTQRAPQEGASKVEERVPDDRGPAEE